MISKGDPDWKRTIGNACRTVNYSTFIEGDDLYALNRMGRIAFHGYVTNWGEFWDYWGWLPDDWETRIPYVHVGDPTPDAMLIVYARRRPPELQPPVKCTKLACINGVCAGPDWCTCHCDHWWMS